MMACRLIVVAAFLAAGCGKRAEMPLSPAAGPRIVSLAPNLTEMIWAVGAGSNLVGRSSACDFPPETRAVPVVGGYGEPSLEMLVAVQPTCIVYVDMADKALANRLRERGLDARWIPCSRLDEIPKAIATIGELAGQRDNGDRLARALRAEIEAARAAPSNPGRPTVFVALWDDPFYTVGRGSFVSELIALAGGTNIGDTVDKPYFQASPEWLIQRNPEAVFCLYHGAPERAAERLYKAPALATLDAVRRRRIYTEFDVNLTLRPGPRVMQSVSRLRDCFSPLHAEQP